MIIYPAIDLRDGKCIRLYQGDYARATVYNSDPFAMAKTFASTGADWLHIVDLDGAKNSDQHQRSLIAALIKESNLNVQTGGGIRSQSQVKELLDQGAKRVIVGSLALKNKNEVGSWFKYFGPDRIVLALDVIKNANQEPNVLFNAWQERSSYSLYELIEYYQTVGLKHLLCTNIALDGTLQGPDYALYDDLLAKFPYLLLQASGGVQSTSDVLLLRKKQLSGVIIGRALYEKKIDLREVLSC